MSTDQQAAQLTEFEEAYRKRCVEACPDGCALRLPIMWTGGNDALNLDNRAGHLHRESHRSFISCTAPTRNQFASELLAELQALKSVSTSNALILSERAQQEHAARIAAGQRTMTVADANRDVVTIGETQRLGDDEIYSMWYECPECATDRILRSFSFCPGCGRKIDWKVEP
jgi:hypothetical protein